MQELEKILEEIDMLIEKHKNEAYILVAKEPLTQCYTETDIEQTKVHELAVARNIIRKHMNDGWIPVEERLPEEKKSVLVQWEKYDRHLNVTLTYLDVMWLEDAEEKVFETINGVPNGKVIAWRPLPEPYCPERSEK